MITLNDFAEKQSVVQRVLRFLLSQRANKAALEDVYRHVRAPRASIRRTLSSLVNAGAVSRPKEAVYQVKLHTRYQFVLEIEVSYVPHARTAKQRAFYRKHQEYTEFQLKGVMTLAPNKDEKKQKKWLEAKVRKYRAKAIHSDIVDHLEKYHSARYVDTDQYQLDEVEETEEVFGVVEFEVALWHDVDKFQQREGLVSVYEP